MAKNKCKCNFWSGALGVILIVLGLYFVVWGFVSQTTAGISWNSFDWNALLFYAIGLVLFGFGKWAKWSGCSNCKAHMR